METETYFGWYIIFLMFVGAFGISISASKNILYSILGVALAYFGLVYFGRTMEMLN